MIRRALAPLALLLSLTLPTAAWATPKVALTAIEGDSEGDVREAVADALDGDDLTLIGKKETNRAVDKIGDISELSEKSAKKLAKDLSADAIIAGTLGKDGSNKVLKFKLFVNGKMKKGFSVKFKSASSRKFKEMLRKKFVEKIDGDGGGGGGGGDDSEEDEPKKVKKVAKAELDDEDPNANVKPKKGAKAEKSERSDEKPEKVAKNGKEKGEKGAKAEKSDEKAEKAAKSEKSEKSDDDEDEPVKRKSSSDDDEEEDEDEGEKRKRTAAIDSDEDDEEIGVSKRGELGGKPARGTNRAAMRVDLGVSLIKRSISFNTNLADNVAPRPPDLAGVPGGRIDGEIYPLAFSNPDSLAAGLGVGFEYDRTARLILQTSAEPGIDSPTAQFHYSAGLRFRFVGKRPTSPSITAMFDIGRSRFQPDRDALMNPGSLDLPDTYYKYVAPGLSFRVPIGTRLAFYAGGAVMLVQDAGEIVRDYSYGRASVFGIDATGGLEVMFMKRIGLRLAGDFTQIGYTFKDGGGLQANSRDGDPTTPDVFGASDRAIGGSATISLVY